jgi:proteasome lid subunit RPN8/RPN11
MLEISSAAVQRIVADAVAHPARERCGLLFGDAVRIAEATFCTNIAADPTRTFEIDPAALFGALRDERRGGPKVIGYWHSHPSGDVQPSAVDAAMAAPDGKLWLIVAGGEFAVWRAGNEAGRTGFSPVPYRVGEVQ